MIKNSEMLSLTDLDPELEKILNNFSSIFDIRIAYYLPDGSEKKIGINKKNSEYCSLLRNSLGYDSNCLKLDQQKRNKAIETGKIQAYTCHGGCIEVVKPIFNGDKILGFIMMGQATTRKRMPENLLKEAEIKGVYHEIEQAYKNLPYFEQIRMQDIIDLFSELTDLVILKNLIHQQKMGQVYTIIEFMKTKDHTITLHQAANLVNLSESRLRHKFLEEYGQSFSQVKKNICMTKAWELVKDNTTLSVQEIAYALGFKDELYFSKVFKNYFGCPPSKADLYFKK
jgi:AraC-like DNA-binding protein